MEQSKRPALLALARALDEADVPYALIGGLAVQIHQREPRTTLDIGVAVLDRSAIPVEALGRLGFRHHENFAHSENWFAADATPVQFTDDPFLRSAVQHADELLLEGITLRVIRAVDLLHEKLRAGSDPARRRSKRLRDLADAQTLLEENPALQAELTPDEMAILSRMPQ